MYYHESSGESGRYEALLSEEPRREPLKVPKVKWNRFVIDPNHSLPLNVWDLSVTALLLATGLLAPFETAFLEPISGGLLVFDCATDAVFILDLCLQFFVAFADPVNPDRVVRDHRKIITNYLAGWFTVDLLSAMPLQVYRVLVDAASMSIIMMPGVAHLRLVRLVRLIRLLRLTRVARLIMRWQNSLGITNTWFTLMKFISAVLFCCHWMACLWGGIAIMSIQDEDERSWLHALRVGKGGDNGQYQGPFQVYIISLYWSIVTITSIGYGDITPQTISEYWVAIVCTSLMASIWAYTIGAVCSIVSSMNPHEAAFKRKMDDINWLMTERNMPDDMCHKIRRYFHETRDMSRQRTEQDLIGSMSPKLQGEYAHFMHQRWIGKVWYLQNMNHEIIVWTARHLVMAVYAPHEEVLRERTLFIVQRGLVALKGKVLMSGDVWGEDMLLSNKFLRDKEKARSLSYISVLMLHVMDLVEVVVHFPEARARLRWSQVQIALLRGVSLISSVLRQLEVKRGIKLADLDPEQRIELFGDILQGKFADSLPFPEDYLGVKTERSRRHSAPTKPKPPEPRPEPIMEPEVLPDVTDDRFEVLSTAVLQLTRQVAMLAAKVDTLSSGLGRAKGPAAVRPSVRQSTAGAADFGPVVRPVVTNKNGNNSGRRQTRRLTSTRPSVQAAQQSESATSSLSFPSEQLSMADDYDYYRARQTITLLP